MGRSISAPSKPKDFYKGKGIIISKVKIVNAEDVSKKPLGSWTPDLAVKLTLDVGLSFYPEMTIAGDFGKEGRWGSAFKVRELFLSAGVVGSLNDDDTIPPELLEELKGKEIKRVSFSIGKKPDGRIRYRDWDLVFPVSADNNFIEQYFYDSLGKSKYLSNLFKPIEDEGEPEIEGSVADPELPDDLPF